jgi:hypothetical protein
MEVYLHIFHIAVDISSVADQNPDPWIHMFLGLLDPDPDPLFKCIDPVPDPFSSLTFKIPTKNKFFSNVFFISFLQR